MPLVEAAIDWRWEAWHQSLAVDVLFTSAREISRTFRDITFKKAGGGHDLTGVPLLSVQPVTVSAVSHM